MSFESISVEGGILAPDFLEKIAERGKQGAGDFGLPSGTSVLDAASAAWGEAKALRAAFESRQKRLEASGKSESPDTATRERWMKPWFEILGFDLTFNKKHLEADGRTYPISHRGGWLPVHIVGNDQTLDEKHGRYSAHAAVQDYLNRSEALWGIVTNGEELRLLRNSVQFTRQAFVQVDLGDILDGDRFDEFLTLYRLMHRTRFAAGNDPTKSADSLIETYHAQSIEESGRLRDRLRDSVEDAILRLGNGFLQHPENESLRAAVVAGTLEPQELYREILYLVYRLLFLLVAEERHLIGASRSTIYASFGLARLRNIAAARHAAPAAHEDYYLQLRSLFYILDDEKAAKAASLPCLNGDLFAPRRIDELSLDNRTLLQVVWRLAYFRDDSGIVRSVNYSALNVEELGSVYESLLDFAPLFETGKGVPGFALGVGMERKSTGSHYTHPDLVAETLKHSLIPVMDERLKEAGADADKQAEALLKIRVIDPAAGSGHFLLAAARLLGRRLAQVRTGNEEPDPKSLRKAIRSVISHCIYGVDKNPLAVDLCKVALWIEGYSEGMPLSFLDHRIRCGDSLVGVFDLSVIDPKSDNFGIPDGAYKPVTGDDKQVAASVARQNKAEREAATSKGLFPVDKLTHSFVLMSRSIDTTEDTTIHSIRKKSKQYAEMHAKGTDWWQEATLCHLWTAAFFAELAAKSAKEKLIPTTGQMKDFAAGRLSGKQVEKAWETARRLRFFHWPLEYPEVFEDGGFDVIIGNPPWDKTKFQEREFITQRRPEIAQAATARERSQLIDRLQKESPDLFREIGTERHDAEAITRFLRSGGRFQNTAVGDLNTYPLFIELCDLSMRDGARCGIIVKTNFLTGDTLKDYFSRLVSEQRLTHALDFSNRRGLFKGVVANERFVLLGLQKAEKRADPVGLTVSILNEDVKDLRQPEKVWTITAEEILLVNPNTGTCPTFFTNADARLVKAIYGRVPVLQRDSEEAAWGAKYFTMLHMTNASGSFRTLEQLQPILKTPPSSRWIGAAARFVSVWEGKLFDLFEHRYGTFEGVPAGRRFGIKAEPNHFDKEDLQQADRDSWPRYWISESEVDEWFRRQLGYKPGGVVVFRDVCRTFTDSRTVRSTIVPSLGAGNKAPMVLFPGAAKSEHAHRSCVLMACIASLTFDYVARQKISGGSLNKFILLQLPVIPPAAWGLGAIRFVVPRVLELVYTSWHLKAFLDDLSAGFDGKLLSALKEQHAANKQTTGGHKWEPPDWAEIDPDGIKLPPFKWDEERRAVLRAELDAYYAKLYGLSLADMRYILDPKDVYGEDFPGETFRVLKDKEVREFGEYRTKRLVLEAWERV